MTIRTNVKRTLDRCIVAQLMRRGYSVFDVATKLNVTVETAHLEWSIVLKEFYEKRDEDTELAIQLILQQYAEIKREAWDAWEKSKLDSRRVVEDEGMRRYEDEMDFSESNVMTRSNSIMGMSERIDKGRGGGKAKGPIKKTIGKVIKGSKTGKSKSITPSKRMELLNRSTTTEGKNGDARYLKIILDCLHAERELRGVNPVKKMEFSGNIINWDLLASGIPDGPIPDVIEEEIAKALLGAPVPQVIPSNTEGV